IFLALSVTGACPLRLSVTRPTNNVQSCVALKCLAYLYKDKSACQRIASALPPTIASRLCGEQLMRSETIARTLIMNNQRTPHYDILDTLVADDFRHGRTVVADRLLLSETEAILVLVRSSNAWG